MTVYVDSVNLKFRSYTMCHMLADSEEELHEMAAQIGVKREWFQPKSTPHYDLCLTKRRLAVLAGAKEIDHREVVDIIKQRRQEAAQ